MTRLIAGLSLMSSGAAERLSACYRRLASVAILLTLAGLPALPGPAAAEAGPRARVALLSQKMLEDLTEHHVLGAVLAIDVPGQDALMLASGHADRSRRQAMSVDHLFQIGSQTKLFTSSAIQLLERQGKLSLDDPVSSYVAGLPLSEDASLRQLLNHSSGMGDSIQHFDPPEPPPKLALSFSDHRLLATVDGPRFAPGSRWDYNNFAYLVLAQVVEQVSGEAFQRFLRERLLQPYGLGSVFIGSADPCPEARMARGYFPDPDGGTVIDTTCPDFSWAGAAGDMIADAASMLRWHRMLSTPGGDSDLGFDQFQRDLVLTGAGDAFREYGLGLMVSNLSGSRLIGHGGNIHGYLSLTLTEPDSGVTYALMANREDYDTDLPARFLSLLSAVHALVEAMLLQ